MSELERDSFTERLKRRKIVQWSIAYLSAAWLVLQVVDVVGEQFAWPTGLERGITVVLAVGFLGVLVLAWFHGKRGRQRVAGVELMALAALLILGGFLVGRLAPVPGAATPSAVSLSEGDAQAGEVDERAVAILPLAAPSADSLLTALGRDLAVTLASTLNGIGDIRTVDPLAVLARHAAADVAPSRGQALAVSRPLGAGKVLTGTLTEMGERVRVDAAWYDGSATEPAARVSVSGDPEDLVALTDSVTLALLRQLWRDQPPQAVSLAALRTASVPALRNYLEGEHALLRGDMPLAVDAFDRAFAADSTFWFAYWRSLYPRGWFAGSPVDTSRVRRLIEHRHNFPPQDRLLLEAWSAETVSERLALLRAVSSRFWVYWPAWYAYGIELVARGPYLGTTHADARAALERTVELNPELATAWDRLGWVATAQGDTATAARAVREMQRAMSDVEFRAEVPRIASIYSHLHRAGLPSADTLTAWVDWISSAPERLRIDFGVGLVVYSRPRVQLALNALFLEREPGAQVTSGIWRGSALAWLTRGAWDSALVAMDQAAAAWPTPSGELMAYGLGVTGAALGATPIADAVLMRPVPAGGWTPRDTAEFAWLDGVAAYVSKDRAALARARDRLRGSSAPYAAALEGSLRAFATDAAGNRARAGPDLARLEMSNADGSSPPALSTTYPFLVPVNRLTAARWLRELGRDGEAGRVLAWSDAIGGAWPSALNTAFGTMALVDRAEIAAAQGQTERARRYYEEFLFRYDMSAAPLASLVDRARAGLADIASTDG